MNPTAAGDSGRSWRRRPSRRSGRPCAGRGPGGHGRPPMIAPRACLSRRQSLQEFGRLAEVIEQQIGCGGSQPFPAVPAGGHRGRAADGPRTARQSACPRSPTPVRPALPAARDSTGRQRLPGHVVPIDVVIAVTTKGEVMMTAGNVRACSRRILAEIACQQPHRHVRPLATSDRATVRCPAGPRPARCGR